MPEEDELALAKAGIVCQRSRPMNAFDFHGFVYFPVTEKNLPYNSITSKKKNRPLYVFCSPILKRNAVL